MIIETRSPNMMLAAGDVLRLPPGACATIVCNRGAIWVTQDGELRDLVLSAGESAALTGGALTLVQAFEPSLVQMQVPPQGCAGARGRPGASRRPGFRAARSLRTGAAAA